MSNYDGLLTVFKKEKIFLLFLFLFSLLVRSLFFGFFLSKNKKYAVAEDTDLYNQVAIQIVKGKGITNSGSPRFWRAPGAALEKGHPHCWRVPGYYLFLALMYKLLGINEEKALWVQVFLSSLLPLLIFLLSLVLFPSSLFLAKLSGIYSAIHIGYLIFSGSMVAEILFCLFFVIFLILFLSDFNFFFCKGFNRQDFFYKNIFLAGIFLGIASLLRPVGHYLMWILMLMFLFHYGSFIQRTKKLAVFFCGWFLIVFGLLLRNYLLTGFIFFHTLPGNHFLYHSAVYIDMHINKNSYPQSLEKVLKNEWNQLIKKEEKKKGRKLNEIERCNLGERLALSYHIKAPFFVIKRSFIEMMRTILYPYSFFMFRNLRDKLGISLPKPRNNIFRDLMARFLFMRVYNNNFLQVLVWVEMVLIYFMLFGFIMMLCKSFFNIALWCMMLKVLPIMSLMIFLTFVCGFERLRLPIEHFFIIIPLYFWIGFFSKFKEIKK